MDPQATLQRIIDIAARYRTVKGFIVDDSGHAPTQEDIDVQREEFAEACEGLAEWLRRGGFAPCVPQGTQYIPGTGTRWALFPPDPRHPTWTLRHYDAQGQAKEVFQLTAR